MYPGSLALRHKSNASRRKAFSCTPKKSAASRQAGSTVPITHSPVAYASEKEPRQKKKLSLLVATSVMIVEQITRASLGPQPLLALLVHETHISRLVGATTQIKCKPPKLNSRARRRNSLRLGRLVSTVPITILSCHLRQRKGSAKKTNFSNNGGTHYKGFAWPAPASNTLLHQPISRLVGTTTQIKCKPPKLILVHAEERL